MLLSANVDRKLFVKIIAVNSFIEIALKHFPLDIFRLILNHYLIENARSKLINCLKLSTACVGSLKLAGLRLHFRKVCIMQWKIKCTIVHKLLLQIGGSEQGRLTVAVALWMLFCAVVCVLGIEISVTRAAIFWSEAKSLSLFYYYFHFKFISQLEKK